MFLLFNMSIFFPTGRAGHGPGTGRAGRAGPEPPLDKAQPVRLCHEKNTKTRTIDEPVGSGSEKLFWNSPHRIYIYKLASVSLFTL